MKTIQFLILMVSLSSCATKDVAVESILKPGQPTTADLTKEVGPLRAK